MSVLSYFLKMGGGGEEERQRQIVYICVCVLVCVYHCCNLKSTHDFISNQHISQASQTIHTHTHTHNLSLSFSTHTHTCTCPHTISPTHPSTHPFQKLKKGQTSLSTQNTSSYTSGYTPRWTTLWKLNFWLLQSTIHPSQNTVIQNCKHPFTWLIKSTVFARVAACFCCSSGRLS